jgi:hypothetical protein
MDAISRDLEPRLPLSGRRRDALFIGKVTVRGVELTYRAFPVSEELINVGRITGP